MKKLDPLVAAAVATLHCDAIPEGTPMPPDCEDWVPLIERTYGKGEHVGHPAPPQCVEAYVRSRLREQWEEKCTGHTILEKRRNPLWKATLLEGPKGPELRLTHTNFPLNTFDILRRRLDPHSTFYAVNNTYTAHITLGQHSVEVTDTIIAGVTGGVVVKGPLEALKALMRELGL